MEITLSLKWLSIELLTNSAIGIGIILFIYSLLKFYFKVKRHHKRKSYPPNTVILHQFPYKDDKPSLSIPCLKLETWLRVNKIKYQNEYSYLDRSSQGQCPFITLNNKDYHDSQFIIEHLSKVYDKSDNLNKTDQAIARGFLKLLEESFKWTLYYHRYLIGKPSDLGLPSIAALYFRPKIDKILKGQGYGRHSTEEVYHIGRQDLQALEDYLDKKKYLFGDKISNEDIILFSVMSQIVYFDKGPFIKFIKNNCPNLIAHFKLIKNQYWPKWSDIQ